MTGTLTDAGPLVALINGKDNSHAACRALLPGLPPPLVTTWPCFTEAMYLLHQAEGHRGQDELWHYVESGALTFHWPSPAETARMRTLMRRYQDTPMDLADASLVTAAETLSAAKILRMHSTRAVQGRPDCGPGDTDHAEPSRRARPGSADALCLQRQRQHYPEVYQKFNSSGVGTQFATGVDLPFSLAFNSIGRLFVTSGNTIEKFNSDGIGTRFNVSGGTSTPIGIAFGPAATPEPSQFAALGIGILGLAGLGLRARRRKADAA